MIMVPALETKISSSSAVIKIVADVRSEKNAEYFNDRSSKELEKSGREYKESSSTQTSSSSSLLHKRKVHSYYDLNYFYKPSSNCRMLLNRPKKHINTTSQRIISAKFLKVKQLQNELAEAQKKITDLQEENRTLKNIHKRQDSALRKYESEDSCLPQLLKSHEEEMRIITLKYKKLRSVHADLESRYNKQYSELITMKDRYQHLLVVSRDKHLLQREQLTKQIEEMKITINDLKNKIKLQARRLDLEAKNHRYQLSVEISKQKSLNEQLRQSEENIQKLHSALKDKEKYMANSKINLHSNRMNQMKLKLPSKSLNPIRKCLNYEEEKFNIIISNINKENSVEFLKREYKMDDVFTHSNTDLRRKTQIENNISEEKSEQKPTEQCLSPPNLKRSDSFKTEHPSEIFLYSPKNIDHSHDKISLKSDNNNNIKQNMHASNTTNVSKLEIIHKNTIFENYSLDKFDSYEKSLQDETCSEKSEDYKATEETVSWLELHEKIKNENEEVDEKWDQFCDSFNPQKSITTPQNKIIEQFADVSADYQNSNSTVFGLVDNCLHADYDTNQINNSDQRLHKNNSIKQNSQDKLLSDDKKLTLLSALRQIDLEKNNTNATNYAFSDNKVVERKSKKDTSRLTSVSKKTVR